ncbi:threonine-phosphate decarboxylase [Chachezhania antarctica]|uniref:threonine-phosphate decarboxylase n=1 Tax=Chachezhania antarctica TaxID=2340860 RepID=UPI000EAEAA08|nr:threonine-phosphate decarboxylase [Chachezhania antarctica]|tara:strand:- start:596 stop:1537 length:942 start_codon:yes stop_codon:yes gene_type:complete
MLTKQDHGGGLDAAIATFGGARDGWLDLSTGINPTPYPIGAFSPRNWNELPDHAAQQSLVAAARRFWQVPDGAAILAAPGLSSVIARLPALSRSAGRVRIPAPTYNEHAAAFDAHGWEVVQDAPADACVLVHPNNPDGRLWDPSDADAPFQVIDESFCDTCPDRSLVALADRPGTVVLKSFGKFWGLAGLRLGFAISRPDTIERLATMLGPWPVSGPALAVGTRALSDPGWAVRTRAQLQQDSARLDRIVTARGAEIVGRTDLFRLYEVDDAQAWQDRLARHHIWSRIFPYSGTWLRLGLPPADAWDRLEAAL